MSGHRQANSGLFVFVKPLGFRRFFLEQFFDEAADGFLWSMNQRFDRFAVAAAFGAKPQKISIRALEDVDARAAKHFSALRANHAGRKIRVDAAHGQGIGDGFGSVCYLHGHIAQTKEIAAVQLRALHWLIVDQRAVGGIHIAHKHSVVPHLNFTVKTRDGVVLDLKIIGRRPSQAVDAPFKFDDFGG